MQAQNEAHWQGNEIVLKRDLEEACRAMRRQREPSWQRTLAVAIGGIPFGIFLQGLIDEITASQIDTHRLVAYITAGFLGLFLIMWGALEPQR